MKKIRLALDSLRVDSFAPGTEPVARGTVAAHQETPPFTQAIGCTYDELCYTGGPCPDWAPYTGTCQG